METCDIPTGTMAFNIPNATGVAERKELDVFQAVDVCAKILESQKDEEGDGEVYGRVAEELKRMGGWSHMSQTQAFFVFKELMKAKEKMIANFRKETGPNSPIGSDSTIASSPTESEH